MFLRIRAGRGNGKCERREQGGADGGGDLHRHHPRGGKAIRKDRRRIRSGVAHTTDAWARLVGTSDIRIRSLDRRTHSHASSPRMRRPLTILLWVSVSALGAAALGRLALSRGETISAGWLLAAALCCYAIGYRFYGRFITAKIFAVDDRRATPAVRMEDGRDYLPTNRWVVFGHHFAAIGGPVQDLFILLASVRRNGRSLGAMARDEIGPVAGTTALVAILGIMVVLIAVLALVVVNALAASPWGVVTIGLTIPIALLMGVHLRWLRPGRVLEASAMGLVLLVGALYAGRWVAASPDLAAHATLTRQTLALAIMVYGFAASVLPVWLLLAPREYLSAFVKIGVV